MTVAIDAGLTIQGYASLWGVADLNGDVVAKGAFADKDDRGLYVRGHISDWSAEARYAQALSRAGALDGLSIGFRAAKARRDGRLRVLSGVELWEVSLVTFPALPGARFSCRGRNTRDLLGAGLRESHHLAA